MDPAHSSALQHLLLRLLPCPGFPHGGQTSLLGSLGLQMPFSHICGFSPLPHGAVFGEGLLVPLSRSF